MGPRCHLLAEKKRVLNADCLEYWIAAEGGGARERMGREPSKKERREEKDGEIEILQREKD